MIPKNYIDTRNQNKIVDDLTKKFENLGYSAKIEYTGIDTNVERVFSVNFDEKKFDLKFHGSFMQPKNVLEDTIHTMINSKSHKIIAKHYPINGEYQQIIEHY